LIPVVFASSSLAYDIYICPPFALNRVSYFIVQHDEPPDVYWHNHFVPRFLPPNTPLCMNVCVCVCVCVCQKVQQFEVHEGLWGLGRIAPHNLGLTVKYIDTSTYHLKSMHDTKVNNRGGLGENSIIWVVDER